MTVTRSGASLNRARLTAAMVPLNPPPTIAKCFTAGLLIRLRSAFRGNHARPRDLFAFAEIAQRDRRRKVPYFEIASPPALGTWARSPRAVWRHSPKTRSFRDGQRNAAALALGGRAPSYCARCYRFGPTPHPFMKSRFRRLAALFVSLLTVLAVASALRAADVDDVDSSPAAGLKGIG